MASSKIDNLISAFRDLHDMEILFSGKEIKILENKLKKILPKKIVYCSFENRFAKSGGLAAVVTNILPYLEVTAKSKLKSSEVLLITPFHSRQKSFKLEINNSLKHITTFSMPYSDKEINVDIYNYNWDYDLSKGKTGSIQEYYLKSDNFFETQNDLGDPYIYDSEDTRRNSNLVIRDSILFCKAVPFAIKQLGYSKDIIFHLQEWQTALISITSKLAMIPGKLTKKGILKSCSNLQTMHNTFDSYETPGYFLEQIKKIANSNDEDKIYMLAFKHILEKNFSGYSIGLPFTDKKITTVSKSFAKEISSDILHKQYFAPHIQSTLKSRGKVIGINNGMFKEIPSDFDFVFDKNIRERDKIEKLKNIKLKNRNDLLTILADYKSENTFGELLYKGLEITQLPKNIPICVMSGRLDHSQKGYDVLLKVIDEFHNDQLQSGKEIVKFILTPMPTKQSDTEYFKEIATKCKGNLLVIAERMKKGYQELQLGSSFGLMPSIFEPFGAAIEYMVNGTLVIARKTGGLKDQITDGENGLLYIEGSSKRKSNEYNIENINHYFNHRDDVRIPLLQNSWVKEMIKALKVNIERAITISEDSDQYFSMVINGFNKATEFSWYKTAQEYYKYYNKSNQ